MRLIDPELLYEKISELETQALEYFKRLEPTEANYEQLILWSAVLAERSVFKQDIADMPIVDAVPVVRCKDCIYRDYNVCTRFAEVYICPDDFCSKGKHEEW